MHFRNHTMNSGCIEAAEGGSKKLCQNYEWAKNNIIILIEYLFGSTLCSHASYYHGVFAATEKTCYSKIGTL